MLGTGLCTVYFGAKQRELRANRKAVDSLMTAMNGSQIYSDEVDEDGYYRPRWSILPHSLKKTFGRKRQVYISDPSGIIRRMGKQNPRVTVPTLVTLQSGKYHDLRFLTPKDEFKRLTLHQNWIDSLAGIEDQSTLEHLTLSECKNLNDCWALRRLPELESLILVSCPKINHLEFLEPISSLKKVEIQNCFAITKAQIQTLKDNRPDLEVMAD